MKDTQDLWAFLKAPHTPGPWYIHSSNSEEWSCHILSRHAPKWPYDTIASIREMYGENCTVPGAHNANARLIAAAPDLLDALRELETAAGFAYVPDERERRELHDAIDKAREVIKKATSDSSSNPGEQK